MKLVSKQLEALRCILIALLTVTLVALPVLLGKNSDIPSNYQNSSLIVTNTSVSISSSPHVIYCVTFSQENNSCSACNDAIAWQTVDLTSYPIGLAHYLKIFRGDCYLEVATSAVDNLRVLFIFIGLMLGATALQVIRILRSNTTILSFNRLLDEIVVDEIVVDNEDLQVIVLDSDSLNYDGSKKNNGIGI